MEKTIKITLAEGAHLPTYMTAGSAGADLYAHLPEPITLPSGTYAAIPTGISLEIPVGLEGQVRPRSGLARRFSMRLVR